MGAFATIFIYSCCMLTLPIASLLGSRKYLTNNHYDQVTIDITSLLISVGTLWSIILVFLWQAWWNKLDGKDESKKRKQKKKE